MKPDEGSFKWGVTTSPSLFPEGQQRVLRRLRAQHARLARASTPRPIRWSLRCAASSAGCSSRATMFTSRSSVLSGGEKVRLHALPHDAVRLERAGRSTSRPTTSIWSPSRRSTTACATSRVTVLFASHDHEFVQTIATRIIEIREKGVLDKECTYDEFLDFRETYKG